MNAVAGAKVSVVGAAGTSFSSTNKAEGRGLYFPGWSGVKEHGAPLG